MKDAKCVALTDPQLIAEFDAGPCATFAKCPVGDGDQCPPTDPNDPEACLDAQLDPSCDSGAITGTANLSGGYTETSYCFAGWKPDDGLEATLTANFTAKYPNLGIDYNRTATVTIFTAKVTNIEFASNDEISALYLDENNTPQRSTLVENQGIDQWVTDGIVPVDLEAQVAAFVNTLLGTNVDFTAANVSGMLMAALNLDPASAASLEVLANSLVLNVAQFAVMASQIVNLLETGFVVERDVNTNVTTPFTVEGFYAMLAELLNDTCTPADVVGDACKEDGLAGICKMDPVNPNDPPPPNGTACGDSCGCDTK
jgi:hypothetical protein